LQAVIRFITGGRAPPAGDICVSYLFRKNKERTNDRHRERDKAIQEPAELPGRLRLFAATGNARNVASWTSRQ
jgi:hypothetical protein